MEGIEKLFERALNLASPWRVERINFDGKIRRLDIEIDFPRGSKFQCPKCGEMRSAYDTAGKSWRHLNFFEHECYLKARVPRIDCEQDGVLQVNVPWAREGADFTLLFESLAMTLCREMPVNTVSKLLGVDDNKLWRMVQFYVDKGLAAADFSQVKKIGADETSKGKGHDYITLIMDLEEKKTIFVAQGKGSDTIVNFKADLIAHGGLPENISDASIDMSQAFIKGLKENFPNAEITFDKFHILKVINEAVDTVRKTELLDQHILRGMKYIFLKNRENLTVAQNTTLRIMESAQGLNLHTIKALHIREAFQEIYKEPGQVGFERMLKRWYFWATHSRLEPMIKAAKTIKSHWDGVLKWFESKVNNGILEGTNSIIQAAKAKARGYRTFKNFRAIIFLITGKLNFDLPT